MKSVTDEQWTVEVSPHGWKFKTTDFMSLVEAARLSDFSLPSSCVNGTCRTCICKLTTGIVRYRVEWPGLSLDEKKAGFILPCVAIAECDLVIHSPAACKLTGVK